MTPEDGSAGQPLIQVFLGTKAQYIKTAPLLLLMDEQQVPYRLIDSGQHTDIGRQMREEYGIREPDVSLEQRGGDVTTVTQAIGWATRLTGRALNGGRLREEVFGGMGGICVVHGDTPSTLIATVMARRAGLRVAHLEAGLRSGSYLHPFPEELIRVATMRMAHLLYAPGQEFVANLRRMKVKGEIIDVGANTVEEALRASIGGSSTMGNGGPVVATMHRVENLKRPGRVDGFVDLLERVAVDYEVLFVAHGPTQATLEKRRLLDRLDRAGVKVTSLLPHAQFTRALSTADFVITDGGSIQEECALLGTPTLVWRERTERPDGLGANVVLSRYDPDVITTFLEDPSRIRVAPDSLSATPSEIILKSLVDALDAMGPAA